MKATIALKRLKRKVSAVVRPRWRPSYAQFGEDVLILSALGDEEGNVPAGIYVDVGAHHPTMLSNTHLLYRRGWCGVNIDLDDENIELFDLMRPRDVNVRAAISDKPGTVEVYKFGAISVFNTLSREQAEIERRRRGIDYVTEAVACETLTQVLGRTRSTGRVVDLLTVDVEGHDLNVLASLDFDLHRPRVVCVEHHEHRIEEVLRSRIYDFLVGRGYDLYAWAQPSLIFRRRDG